jgi:hypothetical protein
MGLNGIPGPTAKIVVLIDIGDVGDAADVENCNRAPPIERGGNRVMVYWHQRRALPSCSQVGSPEIVRNRVPTRRANPGPSPIWAVSPEAGPCGTRSGHGIQ